MKNWIGIDAHSKFCEMAVLNDSGNLIGRTDIITNEKDIVEALLKIRGERYVIVEESSLAQWLYLTIKPYVNKIVISDPTANKWIYKDEIKNDKVDCFKLAVLYQMGQIREVYHTDAEDLALLRRLVIHYNRIVQDSTRAMNRIKATYRYYGVMTEGAKVYNSNKRKEFLGGIKLEGARKVINNYYQQLDLYRTQQKDIIVILRKMSRKYPAIKKIKSVPGIGFIRAITIFALVITPERFSTRSELNKYCGLSTVEKKSAGEVFSSYASRKGNRVLKDMLMGGATSCIFISKHNYFKTRHEELILRGLSEKAARRTIAREIFYIVIGVWRKNENYSSEVHINDRNKYQKKAGIKPLAGQEKCSQGHASGLFSEDENQKLIKAYKIRNVKEEVKGKLVIPAVRGKMRINI